jgi:hypothetical protein
VEYEYSLELSHTIQIIAKYVYSEWDFRWLVNIDGVNLVYTEKYSLETERLIYTLGQPVYLAQTYRVELEDDMPDEQVSIIISLYECMYRCDVPSIRVSRDVPKEAYCYAEPMEFSEDMEYDSEEDTTSEADDLTIDLVNLDTAIPSAAVTEPETDTIHESSEKLTATEKLIEETIEKKEEPRQRKKYSSWGTKASWKK